MRTSVCTIWIFLSLLLGGGCAGTSPRFAAGERTQPSRETNPSHPLAGVASYYADEFHGRKTANGEVYDMHTMTAAHRTLPFGTKIKVKNTTNGKTVIVRVNDRGPFKDDRIIDVSFEAAKQLGMIGPGTAWVELEILETGSD